MEYVRWLSEPTLKRPVVVAAFTGWNDAGDAASGTIRHLIEVWNAVPLAEIDPEEFTDFATIRPQVRLSSELQRSILWPTVGMWHSSTPGGDIILVLGPEPAMRWRSFSEQIVGVAQKYQASMVLTLGALLADVPHTRPVQLIGTASDQIIIDRFDLQRSRYEGPTGIVGVIHDSCTQADLPSASLWAAVPAYAAQVPSPKATMAMMQRLGDIIGATMPTSSLLHSVTDYEARVDQMVDADHDLGGYVRRLEGLVDSGVDSFDEDLDDTEEDDDDNDDDDDAVGGELSSELPAEVDGTALVDEVERFLRDQGK